MLLKDMFGTIAVKLRVNFVVFVATAAAAAVVVIKCFDPKSGWVDFAVRVKSCRPGIALS